MNERKYQDKGLSSFALKMIAIVTMLIDHIAIIFFRNMPEVYIVMRIIGRVSFPLFCFVLTEGFFHTKSRKNYAFRLFVFALISEIPYNKFGGGYFDISRQNVMFTLLIGFLTIWALEKIRDEKIKYPTVIVRWIKESSLNAILQVVVVIIGVLTAIFAKTVYSCAGILLIVCFYEACGNRYKQVVSTVIFNVGMFNISRQWFGTLSAIPIALYNGKPGSKKGKYFFYLFYPIHLVVLLGIRFVLKRI